MTRRFGGKRQEGVGIDEREPVRYIGHDPEANENHYAVVSGFTDLPPIPFASLMAAAPDLLAALEWAMRHVTPIGLSLSKKRTDVADYLEGYELARAAIEKAEGS